MRSEEKTIHEQYMTSIGGAEHYIYIENQTFADLDVINAVHNALERGVRVIVVVPRKPLHATQRRNIPSKREVLFSRIHALDEHKLFTMANHAR